MKKFKFKLEPVLKQRDMDEKEKSVKFSKEMNYLKKIENVLLQIDRGEVDARNQYADLGEGAEVLNPGEFWVIDNFISGQRVRREEIKERLEEQEEKLKSAYIDYITARKQKKIIEEIKERQKKRYDEKAKKYELKEMDDLYTMRHRFRKLKSDEAS